MCPNKIEELQSEDDFCNKLSMLSRAFSICIVNQMYEIDDRKLKLIEMMMSIDNIKRFKTSNLINILYALKDDSMNSLAISL